MKKVINEWQIHFKFGRDYRTLERGWKIIEFGIIKFINFPKEGFEISKQNYKGFLIRFMAWFPIDKY
jgi:hypothetical protein